MKIDGGRPNAEASGTQRVDQAAAERTTRGGRKSDTATDSVALSADAQLATSAVSAARSAPEIRQDRVEAARKALDAGRVGQDAHALADKMIDSLLGR